MSFVRVDHPQTRRIMHFAVFGYSDPGCAYLGLACTWDAWNEIPILFRVAARPCKEVEEQR